MNAIDARLMDSETLFASIQATIAKRAADMPTEENAMAAMQGAFDRLKDLGWKEAMYCPKDGTLLDARRRRSVALPACAVQAHGPEARNAIRRTDMIGPIQTGTLATAQISARIHSGLAVKLPDGRPGKLAIVDDSGAVVDASPAVAREAWLVAIASYKNFLIGQGHLVVLSGPVPGIGSESPTAESR